MFEANLETGEIFWDERVREIFGRSQEGPIGRTEWEESLHPEDAQRMKDILWDAVAQRSSYDADFRIVLPDGLRSADGRTLVEVDLADGASAEFRATR